MSVKCDRRSAPLICSSYWFRLPTSTCWNAGLSVLIHWQWEKSCLAGWPWTCSWMESLGVIVTIASCAEPYTTALATNTATYSVKRPCWCTNVSMVWHRLTCWRTACQPHHTTGGVIYALLHPDYSLFYARWLTMVTAVSLLVVQLCGTIYQLHLDWTCRCLFSVHGWKHFSWHELQHL